MCLLLNASVGNKTECVIKSAIGGDLEMLSCAHLPDDVILIQAILRSFAKHANALPNRILICHMEYYVCVERGNRKRSIIKNRY